MSCVEELRPCQTLLTGLLQATVTYGQDPPITSIVTKLMEQCKVYTSFMENFSAAIQALERCSQAERKVDLVTSSIKVENLAEGRQHHYSLAELLELPVRRMQNVFLGDIIKAAPPTHPDYDQLIECLK